MNYLQWKQQVADIIYHEWNVELEDLQDENYFGNFNMGTSVYQMVDIIMINNE